MNQRFLLLGVAVIAVAFPLLAIASPVAIPNAFTDGEIISADEFNENFDAVAEAVNDNDVRIAALEAAIDSAGVPVGTIAFFPVVDAGTADGCPTGWAEYTDLRGRVAVGLGENGTVEAAVGAALGDEGERMINQVVAHDHAHTFAIATDGGLHDHQTEFDGDHDHEIRLEVAGGYSTFGAVGTFNGSGGDSTNSPIGSDGLHRHDIASSGAHGHTIDGSIQPTGAASVDVTMPYVQLLACAKQ